MSEDHATVLQPGKQRLCLNFFKKDKYSMFLPLKQLIIPLGRWDMQRKEDNWQRKREKGKEREREKGKEGGKKEGRKV